MKKIISAISVLAVLSMLTACNTDVPLGDSGSEQTGNTSQTSAAGGNENPVDVADEEYVSAFSGYDTTETYDNGTKITLNGADVSVDGSGAAYADKTVSITEAGTYIISGTLDDGMIYVEVGDDDKVQLVLDNADITCSTGAAVVIENADKTLITLAGGSENSITDGKLYATTGKPNAALFSKDDLTINGSGALNVVGNCNNGIGCNNDIKIVNGNISVTAKNNGIKGDDSVGIKGGTISVNSSDDGIKSDNDSEIEKGYFYMEGGSLIITATDDGICAINSVNATGGTISVTCGDKNINCDGDSDIADGVMAS